MATHSSLKTSRLTPVSIPWDLLASIVNVADFRTLKILNLVCKDFEEEAARRLWRIITIFTARHDQCEARQHIYTKLEIIRRHVKHLDEIRFGSYSVYRQVWQQEDPLPFLQTLFCLLNQSCLRGLSIGLFTDCPAMRSMVRSHGLPSNLRRLDLVPSETDLGQLGKSLHTLQFLRLHSPKSIPFSAFAASPLVPKSLSLSLPPHSTFSTLRTLKMDSLERLGDLQHCSFPLLEHLSLSGIHRESIDAIVTLLSGLSPDPNHRYSSATSLPTLRSLSLRIAPQLSIDFSNSALCSSLLLHSRIQSSGVLAHMETLDILHEEFPTQALFDSTLLQILEAFVDLKHFRCDILIDGRNYTSYTPLVISEHTLRAAFSRDSRATQSCQRLEEIVLNSLVWRDTGEIIRPSPWVRKYRARTPQLDGREHEDAAWEVVDERMNSLW
ncbi:hypothetical protein DL93DRAFT_2172853 [Clavulina sp. PMI_390]|nr:hypothetical protein DL93DRAFT_2172853 [Clavulina sp. PMI_390]